MGVFKDISGMGNSFLIFTFFQNPIQSNMADRRHIGF